MPTVIVPYRNGSEYLQATLQSLPSHLPVIVVDDWSNPPLRQEYLDQIRPGVILAKPPKRGYFAGAVNRGIDLCSTDVLIINQDLELKGEKWLQKLLRMRSEYALIGDGVMGHPAWPDGYVQGTFMFVRRDAIESVGKLNESDYPLWGGTAEWQLRMYRAGYKFHASHDWRQYMLHVRDEAGHRYGKSIAQALEQEPQKKFLFIKTPPEISVIVPCYNYGHYLQDAIGSLVGGQTSLGNMPGQSYHSFEIIIVDDCSPDGSFEIAKTFEDRAAGIRAIQTPHNLGTAGCLNYGISQAYGAYIHLMSADDMRESHCLETLYNAVRNDRMLFSYGNVTTFADGERVKHWRLPDFDPAKLIDKNHVPLGIMYHRSAWEKVGGYPEIMRYGREDWAFNVALALNGYCGIHIGNSGNLYRREGQNRSLKTGNVHSGEDSKATGNFDWKTFFRRQISYLFPGVDRRELNNMCCGSSSNKTTTSKSAATRGPLVGRDGLVRMEYQGKNFGTRTFYCADGTRYRFGRSRLDRFGLVAVEHVDEMLQKDRFKVIQEKQPEPAPKPEAVEKLLKPTTPVAEKVVTPSELPPMTKAAIQAAERIGLTPVDIAGITPTGKNGKIIKSDVTRLITEVSGK